jgi:heat-inducible transcriptional repressor
MESFRFQRQEIGELLRQTALLLANLSGYAGFVLSPRLEESELESIVFVKLDVENALVVIISELGIVEHRVIRSRMPNEELQEISRLLGEKLRGRRLSEVRAEALRYAEEEGWSDPIVQSAFLLLKESLEHGLERRLYVEGLFNLLEHLFDEGHGLEEARRILALLGDSKRFGAHLEKAATPQIQACIGSENPLSELRPCSLVLMGYGTSGVLGLLGPIRMDYSKAFSITTYIGNRLQAILTLSHREHTLTLEREVS